MDILDTIGPLSVDDFMRRHWQRAPLLARGAFPRFASPIEPAARFELARRDDVESRLVAADGDRWTLRRGPFERLPPRRRPRWTLLVQGTDLHDDAMHALMSRYFTLVQSFGMQDTSLHLGHPSARHYLLLAGIGVRR